MVAQPSTPYDDGSLRNDPGGPLAPVPFRPSWRDALDILEKEYPPLEWIIPGVLPEGLTMLFSRPKVGKSMVALALGLRMALRMHGGVDGEVGFLSLDDRTERRLQTRMRDLLQGMELKRGRMYFCFDALRLDQGLLQQLEWTMEDHPRLKLLVVDVYMSVKPKSKGGKDRDIMLGDYEALEPLREFARRHHIAVLLLHHSRKPKAGADAGDFLDEIGGSTGLPAACDTIWKLERARGGYKMSLHQTGRDVLDGTLHLSLADLGAEWVQVIAEEGEGEEASATEQRILDLLESGETEVLSPQEITTALGIKHNTTLSALRRLLAKKLISQTTYGRYTSAARELQNCKTSPSAESCNSAILQLPPPISRFEWLVKRRSELRAIVSDPDILKPANRKRHQDAIALLERINTELERTPHVATTGDDTRDRGHGAPTGATATAGKGEETPGKETDREPEAKDGGAADVEGHRDTLDAVSGAG
jgi:hypothetical protein